MGGSPQQDFADAAPRRTTNAQDACAFEAATGMTGIAGTYVFPRGMSADEYQDYTAYSYDVYALDSVYDPARGWTKQPATPALDALKERLRADWDELAALNPELKKIDVNRDDGLELHVALNGAVSRYSVRDINFVLHAPPEKFGDDFYDAAAKALKEKIECASGRTLQWAASPATLREMERQLQARTATATSHKFIASPDK